MTLDPGSSKVLSTCLPLARSQVLAEFLAAVPKDHLALVRFPTEPERFAGSVVLNTCSLCISL